MAVRKGRAGGRNTNTEIIKLLCRVKSSHISREVTTAAVQDLVQLMHVVQDPL